MPIFPKESKALISLNLISHTGRLTGRLLPLSRRPATACGKALSALFLVLAGSLGVPPALAAGDARGQIEQAIGAQLDAQFAEEARRNGWQGLRTQYSHELLGAPPALACASALQVQRRSEDASPLARQRFEVHCADAEGWTLMVSTQASAFLPVVYSSGVLERGAILGSQDLQLQPLNIARAPHGFFTRIDQVVGQSARRRIRAGQPLSPALLGSAQVVKRGQQVRINASRDGIEASAPGEALANGQQGDVIKVRNLGSQKVIQAQVVDAGVVSSTYQ